MKSRLLNILKFLYSIFAGFFIRKEKETTTAQEPGLIQRIINHYRQPVHKSYRHNNRKRTTGRRFYYQRIYTEKGIKIIYHKNR